MRYSLTIFLIFFGYLLPAQDCFFSIKGHVVDKDMSEHLANANITIVELGKSVVTNSKGDFEFVNICKGNYTIIATHVSCATYTKEIKVDRNIHLDIEMPHSINIGGQASVTAQKEKQNTGLKMELSGTALDATRGGSLAEALSKLNGVTMLQTGATVSKPVIHGLFGSRLLLINNGVRQEGQQWGNEHAPEVDPFLADKLTVIKGVDELKYGSDAIGGVILVEPKIMRTTIGKSLSVNTGYFTNNNLYYASAIYEEQLKRHSNWTYRVQGSFKKGANASTPSYRMNNTGLQESNFSFGLRYKQKSHTSDIFVSHFNTTLGIFSGSHIGNITDLQNAIKADKPDNVYIGQRTYVINRPRQEVNHQLFKAKTTWVKPSGKWSVLLSAQRNNRQEFDIVRSSTTTKPQLDLTILTFSQDINLEHSLLKKSNGFIGVSAVQQINNYSGRYFIPNYVSQTYGLYAIQKWSNIHWEYQAGIRADYKIVNTTRLKFNGQELNYDFSFPTIAASFNTAYKHNQYFKTNLNIALSSRAPYVNELLSDGIHHGTATYEQGNIFLQTEKSLFVNWNLNYKSKKENLLIDLSIHNNLIHDFIYQQPRPDAPVLTIAGAFPKIEWLQTNAMLTGADFSLQYNITKPLQFTTKLSVLYARNITTKDWLIWMPANRWHNQISYAFNDSKLFANNTINVEWLQVAEQKRIPNGNIPKYDFKAPPVGYQLVNMSFSTDISVKQRKMNVLVGIQNLFNTKYRDYLNTFRYFTDELGRNISIKLKFSIF